MAQSFAYSFQDVQCAISGPGGSFSIGAQSGVSQEGITVAYADNKNTMVVGADGTPQHSLHAGNAGTVRVRLLKTSPFNQYLNKMYSYQKGSAANWGQNVITLRNPVSGDTWTASTCAFQKHPDGNYAQEAGMNEWIFDAGYLDPLLGNGAPSL